MELWLSFTKFTTTLQKSIHSLICGSSQLQPAMWLVIMIVAEEVSQYKESQSLH